MMQQYLEVKESCKDCILFFRLGDFYEMFFEDAETASKELELTKSPMHLFCDGDGKIIDIISGIPTIEWMESHILPLYQQDMKLYE